MIVDELHLELVRGRWSLPPFRSRRTSRWTGQPIKGDDHPVEIPAPNVVNRNGFDRSIYQTMVTSGEEVTVTAYAARDGSKQAWAGGLTRADGRTVITLSGIPQQGGGRGGPGGPQGPPPQ